MRAYLRLVLGTYTPTGDSIATADWEYIIGGVLLCLGFIWIMKFLFSLFK